jgi:hypothetical protein
MSFHNYKFMDPKDPITIPSFNFLPDNDIKVYYLEATLCDLEQIQIPGIELTLYHTGLGFVSEDIKFYIDFTAKKNYV